MDDLVRGHTLVRVHLQAVRIKDNLAAAGDQNVDQVFRGHGIRHGVLQGQPDPSVWVGEYWGLPYQVLADASGENVLTLDAGGEGYFRMFGAMSVYPEDPWSDTDFQRHRVRLRVLQGLVFGFGLLDIIRTRYVFRRLGFIRRHILRGVRDLFSMEKLP